MLLLLEAGNYQAGQRRAMQGITALDPWPESARPGVVVFWNGAGCRGCLRLDRERPLQSPGRPDEGVQVQSRTAAYPGSHADSAGGIARYQTWRRQAPSRLEKIKGWTQKSFYTQCRVEHPALGRP